MISPSSRTPSSLSRRIPDRALRPIKRRERQRPSPLPVSPLLSIYAHDPIVASLLPDFCRHLAAKISQLQNVVVRRCWEETARLCHELEGATSQYGFPTLTMSLAIVHQQVRQDPVDLHAIERELKVILATVERTRARS